MDNVLTILLVEDDLATCQNFIEYADTFEDVSFVSVTNNSAKALQDVRDYLRNAIILDLELHHGGGSGLEVLQGIKDMMLDVNPYILITTNNSSSVTYEYARQLGADYILYKHQENYSEKEALNLLRTMKNIIKSKFKASPQQSYTSETSAQRNQRIIRR
ncbi:MAG: response regulator, partial [Lachnospiraceae bacterium]|nr:response regulator [Lachnospiraceae bacterium]